MSSQHSESIEPPFPAPYLAGIPSLADALLENLAGGERGPPRSRRPRRPGVTAADVARARETLDALRLAIRQAREVYERRHGVVIRPEKPEGLYDE